MHFKGASFLALIVSCVVAWTNSENATQIGKKRIIGGQTCSAQEYKGMASIKDLLLRHLCGGTVLNDRWILTAAHCIEQRTIIVSVSVPNEADIRNLYIPRSLHRHPQYNPADLVNNVGLIQLDTPIPREKLTTVTYPPWYMSEYDIYLFCNQAQAKGWGYTNRENKMSKKLNCVDLEVLPQETCILQYRYYAGKSIRSNDVVCTSSRSGKDACTGDTGGPIICKGVQIGIISWGIDCANPKYPGIFTRVDRYLTYITETMKGKRFKDIEDYLESVNRGQMVFTELTIGFILLPLINIL